MYRKKMEDPRINIAQLEAVVLATTFSSMNTQG